MKTIYAAICAILLICAANLIGQSEYQAIMNDVFPSEGTGGAAIVVKDGEVLYHGAAGMAHLELNVPMEKAHRFRMGSITKQFTAVAILQLLEAGKIGLQDEITKFIPDYPTKGKKITVEHLLTHTSGIKSYTSLQNVMEKEVRTDYSPTELTAFFKDEDMDFDPGEMFNYNNSGYFLLGMIIEKVSGQTYAEYLKSNIFDPLGLGELGYDFTSKIVENRIPGYEPTNDGVKNADYLSMTIPYAAGSLIGTVQDLYRWNKALHEGKLIDKKTLAMAHAEYQRNDGDGVGYGYGWGIGEFMGDKMVEHGGGINGFLTQGQYIPSKDLFIAVFSNCTCKSPDAAAERLTALALGNSLEFKTIDLAAAEMKQYEGVYQIGEDDYRVVMVQDDALMTKRNDGRLFPVLPYEKDKFYYADSRSTIHFERDASGKIKGHLLTPVGREGVFAKWSDEPMPDLSGVKLSEAQKERIKGKYFFEMLSAHLYVTIEEGKVYGRLDGQRKELLTAKSETQFVVPNLGVKIDFEKGDPSPGLKLEQGGQELEAKRVSE